MHRRCRVLLLFFFNEKKKRFNYVAGKWRALSQMSVRSLLTKYQSIRSVTLDSGTASHQDLFSPFFPSPTPVFGADSRRNGTRPLEEASPLPPAASSRHPSWTRTNGPSLARCVRWSHPSGWNISLQKSKINITFQVLIHMATRLCNCCCWNKWSRSKRRLRQQGQVYSSPWLEPLG